jgi:hypothetical protein
MLGPIKVVVPQVPRLIRRDRMAAPNADRTARLHHLRHLPAQPLMRRAVLAGGSLRHQSAAALREVGRERSIGRL